MRCFVGCSDGWLVVGKKCGKCPTAGYITGLSLVRISSNDARLAPGFMVQMYTDCSTGGNMSFHIPKTCYFDFYLQIRICTI